MNTALFSSLIQNAQNIVIIQADNPDGDSLASALALDGILSSQQKNISMYCGVVIPTYLRYMDGWDRIQNELPRAFDLSIIVDTSAVSLLETLQKTGEIAWLKSKPCIIIDHHETNETIDFSELAIIQPEAVSTGEIIYQLAINLDWKMSVSIGEFIAYSVLSDSLGLTSEAVRPSTFHLMGDLVDRGVSIAKIDDQRRSLSKKSARIVSYKGHLLQKLEFYDDPRIVSVTIPWEEIETYSHEYNPSMLVIDEMRMIDKICVAIAYKTYPDGKITAKIRSNYGYKIAGKLAEHFGGGGHAYAAGFKIQDKRSLVDIKSECILVATELLGDYNEQPDGTIQHSF